MWPNQLAFNFSACRMFLSSLTQCDTSSFLTRSARSNEDTEMMRAAQHRYSKSTFVPESVGKSKQWVGGWNTVSVNTSVPSLVKATPACLVYNWYKVHAANQILVIQRTVISSLFFLNRLFQRRSVILYEVLAASAVKTRVFCGATLFRFVKCLCGFVKD